MFLREIEVTVGQTVKSVRLDQQYEGDTGVVVCQESRQLIFVVILRLSRCGTLP